VFTGIIEELGNAVAIERRGDAARLTVRGPMVVKDARHGDSIAVNGVCLTVVTVDGDTFTADVMKETLDRSCLGALREGDPVNLERAATLGTRLGGHLVQGHVDGVGRIAGRTPGGEVGAAAGSGGHWEVVRIVLPPGLSRYLVEKGSITVDGVSLTVTSVEEDGFAVSLIPTTLELTTLGHKDIGAPVNLEVDVVAKYVEKLIGARS
jgi:riboflavin synthase